MHQTPLRDGRPEDAERVARFHVEVRTEAFGRFLPPAAAVGLPLEERTQQWREFLSHPSFGRDRCLLVAENSGRIVGFVAGGPPRREVPGHDSQLLSIYVLAPHRGRGLGRDLFHACAGRLLAAGYSSMALFTPALNSDARCFYERLGGRLVLEARRMVAGVEMVSVAYGWRLDAQPQP